MPRFCPDNAVINEEKMLVRDAAIFCIGLALFVQFHTAVRAERFLSPTRYSNKPIKSIEIEVLAGAGEQLDGNLALDLGFEFPLWLHVAKEATPFGVYPTTRSGSPNLSPGESSSFEFVVNISEADDVPKISAELLPGKQVSQISRIGFLGSGDSDWRLRGYELKINGKKFAANDHLNASLRASKAHARRLLRDLDLEIRPLEKAIRDSPQTRGSKLENAEKNPLVEEYQAVLKPLLEKRHKAQQVIDADYPWVVDFQFEKPAVPASGVKPRASVETKRFELKLSVIVPEESRRANPFAKPTPAANAKVTIWRNNSIVAKGTTDSSGRFTAQLKRGKYTVEASHEKHGPAREVVTVSEKNQANTIVLSSTSSGTRPRVGPPPKPPVVDENSSLPRKPRKPRSRNVSRQLIALAKEVPVDR